jgi:hypothetical protein
MGAERKPDPSPADIERAWLKPRPQPVDASPGYVRSIHRWQRTNWRFTKVLMVLWFGVVGLITLSAAVDVIARLGWGYQAKDIGLGLLMIAVGGLAIPVFWVVKSLVASITRGIYRPEPGADEI